jgi:predicted HTH domain antitoxin
MQLTVSEDIVLSASLSEAEVRLTLALALFRDERITLAQAARLSGVDRLTFQHHLASRHIPLHYGEEEFAGDLRTLETL